LSSFIISAFSFAEIYTKNNVKTKDHQPTSADESLRIVKACEMCQFIAKNIQNAQQYDSTEH